MGQFHVQYKNLGELFYYNLLLITGLKHKQYLRWIKKIVKMTSEALWGISKQVFIVLWAKLKNYIPLRVLRLILRLKLSGQAEISDLKK